MAEGKESLRFLLTSGGFKSLHDIQNAAGSARQTRALKDTEVRARLRNARCGLETEAEEETEMDQAKAQNRVIRGECGHISMETKLPRENPFDSVQVIAVTSGKGGVGKTNVVANLAYCLCRSMRRVLILDADIGLANLDVLLGLLPKYTLKDVVMGERAIEEIIIEGPGGIKILPASSGVQELTQLTVHQRILLMSQLESLSDPTHTLLIDTPTGISSNVMFFNSMANKVIVVVSPEPTSIAAAYAMIKVQATRYSEKCFYLLVNFARNEGEAMEVYRQLSMVADRFLNLSIRYLGYIPIDPHVKKAVRQQSVVTELYPDCLASRSFQELAEKIEHLPAPSMPRGNLNLYWHSLTEKHVDQKEEEILPKSR